MAFPKKYQKLLETKLSDIVVPDFAWLTYAVCACEVDSCGWGGWIIETVVNEATGRHLNIDDRQICPQCGKELFRTEASLKFVVSEDQTPSLTPGVDYETIPMEFDDE
ncbi:MAG: hypothetical protein WC156_14580 [Pedobacter sp.]